MFISFALGIVHYYLRQRYGVTEGERRFAEVSALIHGLDGNG